MTAAAAPSAASETATCHQRREEEGRENIQSVSYMARLIYQDSNFQRTEHYPQPQRGATDRTPSQAKRPSLVLSTAPEGATDRPPRQTESHELAIVHTC